jgi:hypothetical protein
MTSLHPSKPRLMVAGVCLGIAFRAGLAMAQSLPNFSGIWEPITSPGTLGTSVTQTVTHTDTTLTLGHASQGGGHRFVYKLDGSPNHSTLMHVESVATVSVGRDTLTIARVDRYPDGRIRENTQVWSLDAAGNLVIEATDGLRGNTPEKRKTVYKKRTLAKH